MRKYLDYLLINNIETNEDILSNSLFISYDDISALRKDYMVVISKLRVNASYTVIKSDVRVLQEGYEQGLFIIKLENKDIFIRMVLFTVIVIMRMANIKLFIV